MKKHLLSLITILLLVGCGVVNENSSGSLNTSDNYVEVFTLAPVVNALVTDANNQVATYDEEKHKYFFKDPVLFPVKAEAQDTTFIDIDYDNTQTSADLKPSTFFVNNPLQSYCSALNHLTSIYYNKNLRNDNTSTADFNADIQQRFNIDPCLDAQTHIDNAKVLFGIYNYATDIINRIDPFSLDDIQSDVTQVEEFFQEKLSALTLSDEEKIHYYSAYDALVELDRKKVLRVDTIHKPEINPILRPELPMQTNSNVDVFDILPYNDVAYLAAGHDELALVDADLQNLRFESNVSLLSFGSKLYQQSYQGADCLFLANSKMGVGLYEINSNDFNKTADIASYVETSGNIAPFTNKAITNVNGYISVNENKRLLGIATQDRGYFLLNIKEHFNQCTPTTPIKDTDFIIEGNGLFTVDSIFRDDGTYLYTSHKNVGLYGYKLDILEWVEVNTTKKNFPLKDEAEAYNLNLFNNDNELLITTDQGLQIYDVGSAVDSINFISAYTTEGAEKDYFQEIDSYEDFVFLTDGYQGIKVLKLSNSFEPMLCGVEYFAPRYNPYDLAKTTSVKYDNGYLYVGIASYGVVKFRLNDILFQHCR